jgi:hypothetical protein
LLQAAPPNSSLRLHARGFVFVGGGDTDRCHDAASGCLRSTGLGRQANPLAKRSQMFSRIPSAAGSPSHVEQQHPPQTRQPGGSTDATARTTLDLTRRSASPAGPSLQSLPPRSVVALPSLPLGQPLASGPAAGTSGDDVVDLTMIRKLFPKLQGERKQVHARRLQHECSRLTLAQIGQTFGRPNSPFEGGPGVSETAS